MIQASFNPLLDFEVIFLSRITSLAWNSLPVRKLQTSRRWKSGRGLCCMAERVISFLFLQVLGWRHLWQLQAKFSWSFTGFWAVPEPSFSLTSSWSASSHCWLWWWRLWGRDESGTAAYSHQASAMTSQPTPCQDGSPRCITWCSYLACQPSPSPAVHQPCTRPLRAGLT